MKHQDFTIRKGKKYISVTTALEIINNEGLNRWRGEVGNRLADVSQKLGADNGLNFHKYCAIIDKSRDADIDYDEIWEPVLSNLLAFQQWQLHNVVKPVVIEKKFFSDKYLYCGTPDRVYLLRGNKTPDLIDFKTGKTLDMKKIRFQLSAYQELLKENGIETINRIVLHFQDGAIKPITLDRLTHVSDFQGFLYAKETYIRYLINP